MFKNLQQLLRFLGRSAEALLRTVEAGGDLDQLSYGAAIVRKGRSSLALCDREFILFEKGERYGNKWTSEHGQ